ncbi:TPR-like protein [Calocera cornea HHB12733]|uniref:TPR-like protein n=1 Tax=Calocera cornea HHB12733 TaxID=1353952 RepID=A0A165DCJ4_9BASI|nr:TPR-like protein [Calocera cornea HHB12733]
MARPPSPSGSTDSFRSAQQDLPDDGFTDSEIRALLDEAAQIKEQGNALFRQGRWEEAREKYQLALGVVPVRGGVRASGDGPRLGEDEGVPPYVAEPPEEAEEQEGIVSDAAAMDQDAKRKEEAEPPLERESRLARAVLHNNVAACFVKLGEHARAVDACSEALKDDPAYVKALLRRALSGREVGSWSALSAAQEDLQKLLLLLPPSSPLLPTVRTTLAQITPEADAAAQREKDAMLGKLKELGNTVLGRFGLSTDNFRLEPDGKGGYGMSFQR